MPADAGVVLWDSLWGDQMRLALLVASAIFALPAAAQSLFEVPMAAQAQMRVDSTGQVESCGMRVTGAHVGNPDMLAFDTSLMLMKEGRGSGKITGLRGPVSKGLEGLEPVQVYGGWFRAEGKRPTMPLTQYLDGSTPKSKLFLADWTPTLDALDAMTNGRPIQLSISWESGTSAIYFGVVQLEDAHKRQFLNCLADLSSTISAEIGAATKP